MQEQLPTDVFKERTWTYSQRVLGGLPNSLRILNESKDDSKRPVPTERRDPCTCPLRHATSTSM